MEQLGTAIQWCSTHCSFVIYISLIFDSGVSGVDVFRFVDVVLFCSTHCSFVIDISVIFDSGVDVFRFVDVVLFWCGCVAAVAVALSNLSNCCTLTDAHSSGVQHDQEYTNVVGGVGFERVGSSADSVEDGSGGAAGSDAVNGELP